MRNHFEKAGSFFRNLGTKKDEEKVPFANDSIKQNNGAILQSFQAAENSQITTKTVEKRSLLVEPDKGPMSKSRKACFLLSFNVWILYFAAFLWFIPCYFSNCPGTKKWNATFSNMELTSQLEAIGKLVIFGYQNTSIAGNQGMLLALDSVNGEVIWTQPLNIIPLQIHCGKIALEEFALCTAIDETKMIAFNSSNGEQLWQQVIISDSVYKQHLNVLVCGSSQTPISINREFWIDMKFNQYKILNLNVPSKSVELKFIDFPIDCNELFHKMKPINMNDSNESSTVFVCIHSRSISLWAISTRFLCGHNVGENGALGKEFQYLYSINETKLEDNVLIADTVNYGFVVSWSNTLLLISKEEPHSEIWRHSFKNFSAILSIIPGHFTSTGKNEIAVTVQDENRNVMIHVLNLSDGSMVSSMSVDERTLKTLSLIPGDKSSEVDHLLLHMGTSNFTMPPESSKIWQISDVTTKDDFYENSILNTINLKKRIISRLTISSSLKSKVIIKNDKDVDLVLAERKLNSGVVISDYILKSSVESSCS